MDFQKLSSMNQVMGLSVEKVHPMPLHLPEQCRSWIPPSPQGSCHQDLHHRRTQTHCESQSSTALLMKERFSHNPRGLNLGRFSMSGPRGHQYTLIALSSLIRTPTCAPSALRLMGSIYLQGRAPSPALGYTVSIPVSSLAPSPGWALVDLYPALSLAPSPAGPGWTPG